jgi:hypothetical protein
MNIHAQVCVDMHFFPLAKCLGVGILVYKLLKKLHQVERGEKKIASPFPKWFNIFILQPISLIVLVGLYHLRLF